MQLLNATILGVVQGLTEFLPISSTGHLIVVGHLLNFEGPIASSFEIFIQLGSILAIVFLYKERFVGLCSLKKSETFSGLRGLMLLGLTTFPALIIGVGVHGFIKRHLFNPATVAIGLGLGGIAILLIERYLPKTKKTGLDSLSWRDALLIGFFQCLAMWPGVSRSASTILGGMLIGIDRKTSAEYSFLAAVPVMFAATTLDLYKSWQFLSRSDISVFVIGFIVAFIFAYLSVRFLIRFLTNHTLRLFGWYRIIVAPIVVLVLK